MIEVFAPGTTVLLNNHKAKVIAVHLYPKNAVRYTVVHWKDGTRIETIAEGFEVEASPLDTYTRSIGFKA